MSIEFTGCPDCGVSDPSNFTVEYHGEELTQQDALTFFKSPAPDHIGILISCDECDYSVARSTMMN